MKKLLATMFKIGCIGFGGGTALVPVIESEVVYEKKLIDKEEYTYKSHQKIYSEYIYFASMQ